MYTCIHRTVPCEMLKAGLAWYTHAAFMQFATAAVLQEGARRGLTERQPGREEDELTQKKHWELDTRQNNPRIN